jgi:hypothetical protein
MEFAEFAWRRLRLGGVLACTEDAGFKGEDPRITVGGTLNSLQDIFDGLPRHLHSRSWFPRQPHVIDLRGHG